MPDKNILVPNNSKVELNGKIYEIGKLSISQAFKLGQLITTQLLSSQEKLQQLSEKANSKTSNAQDIITIIGLLEEESIVEFFQIVLKDPSIKEIDLENAIEIVAIVCEYNKFTGIKKNFQRIVSAVTKMMTPESET